VISSTRGPSSATSRSTPPRTIADVARYSLDPKKRKELYTEATRMVHDEKPWLELFQEVVIYGVSKRMTFKPRSDYRLIVSEMTVGAAR
jgi:ABC-type transport system substrate-binding protein